VGKQKRTSPHTIASCRDPFRLLLPFVHDRTGRPPATVRVRDLDLPLSLRFLDQLEQQRGTTVRSRNIRRSAIRSRFRVMALRAPASVAHATRILALAVKREDKPLLGDLTREEIAARLAGLDRTTWAGRRDYALLLTMDNTGARGSELLALAAAPVRFAPSPAISFSGNGRKERRVPLWPHTARTLQAWLPEMRTGSTAVVFPKARGGVLSREGVDYLLRRAKRQAQTTCPSLRQKPVAPPRIRHSPARHLPQAGVEIAGIALWLGHESLETTHVYLEPDLAMKEHALHKLTPIVGSAARFPVKDPLLHFLASL
jgi:integrase/recombinase XerD